ncbi:MAG TPA: hypothetical protein VGK00_16555 [Anaerolineales bacterium]|jgi:hypothetical protein
MSQWQLILIIVVAAFAGYLFGMLDSRVTAGLRKKNEKPAPVEKPEVVEKLVPVVHNRPGEHTVLEVTTDQAQGWHLELDGVRLDDPGAISPEQRQKVISTVTHIRPFLETKPVPAAPAMTTPPPAPVATPADFTPYPVAPQPAMMEDNLKISAMRGLGSMLNNDLKLLAAKKPTSIVMMIDEVLQAKLKDTPLWNRGIKLEDGASGGVIVNVGTQRYNGIDAVPEPEIRAIIKAAATEWDKNR